MKTTLKRDLAAKALDLTHRIGERGPKTFNARRRVAEWLDMGGAAPRGLRRDVAWLLQVAKNN